MRSPGARDRITAFEIQCIDFYIGAFTTISVPTPLGPAGRMVTAKLGSARPLKPPLASC